MGVLTTCQWDGEDPALYPYESWLYCNFLPRTDVTARDPRLLPYTLSSMDLDEIVETSDQEELELQVERVVHNSRHSSTRPSLSLALSPSISLPRIPVNDELPRNSQDPLLISSPTHQLPHNACSPIPHAEPISAPSSRAVSVDPLYMGSSPFRATPPATSQSNFTTPGGMDIDPTGDVKEMSPVPDQSSSPTADSVHVPPISPFRDVTTPPPRARSLSQLSPVLSDFGQERSPSPADVNMDQDNSAELDRNQDDAEELVQATLVQASGQDHAAIEQEIVPPLRDGLRTRRYDQLHPFRADDLRYRNQMRSIPEAIVRARKGSPDRHHHGHESTQDAYEPPPAEESRSRRNDENISPVKGPAKKQVRIPHRNAEAGPSRLPARPSGTSWLGLEQLPDDDEELPVLSPPNNKRQEKYVPAWHGFEPLEDSDEDMEQFHEVPQATAKRRKRFPLRKRLRTASPSPHVSDDNSGETVANSKRRRSPSISTHSAGRSDAVMDLTEDDSLDETNNEESNPGIIIDPSRLNAKELRRYQALSRMLPASAILKELKKQKTVPTKRRRPVSSDEDSDAPLSPGKSKTRKSLHPRNTADIKGDSESSEEEREIEAFQAQVFFPPVQFTGSDSDSDIEIVETRVPRKHDFLRAASVAETVSTNESGSDDEIHQEDIQRYLEDEQTRLPRKSQGKLVDTSIVDYMLSRPVNVRTGQRPARTSEKRAGPRKHKIHIVTRDARGKTGRQTRLDFEPRQNNTAHNDYTNDKPSSYRATHHQRESSTAINDRHYNTTPEPEVPHAGPSNHQYFNAQDVADVAERKKQQKKQKQQRQKTNGTYSFHNADGTRITSGRRQPNGITVDIEDEEFHTALVPLSQNWANYPSSSKPASTAHDPRAKPPSVVHGSRPKPTSVARGSKAKPTSTAQAPRAKPSMAWTTHAVESTKAVMGSGNIKRDFDIPSPASLSSGISFATDTYIGRGALFELVDVINNRSSLREPVLCDFNGKELGPDTTVSEFSTSLSSICDGMFDLVFRALVFDRVDQMKEFAMPMRTLCRILSRLLQDASDNDLQILSDVVLENSLRFVVKMNEYTTKLPSDDSSILDVSWFTVELLVRLKAKLPSDSVVSGACEQAVQSLVAKLLRYRLERTIRKIRPPDDDSSEHAKIDTKTTTGRSAELWVCLIHALMPITDGPVVDHPLWSVVDNWWETENQNLSNLPRSEEIWRTIFSLCVLSQFTAHGLTTSKSNLPAHWDLVALALRQICLVSTADSESGVSPKALDARDEYIRLIGSRFWKMCTVWKWPLDRAPDLLTQLMEISRSRLYANLRGEPCNLVDYMQQGDLSLLTRYKRHNTSFEMVLKLIVQAVGPDFLKVDAPPAVLPLKIKKLLNSVMPVSVVTLTDDSELYNRFALIAIAIILDPSTVRDRIGRARSFVNFIASNDTTRVAYLRCIVALTDLMIQRSIPLTEIWPWIAHLGEQLLLEYSTSDQSRRTSALFGITLLLGGLRKIIESGRKHKPNVYPDPALLEISWVTTVFAHPIISEKPNVGLEIRRLLQTFLDARSEVIPAPVRPRLAPVMLEGGIESQDYFDDDLDLTDPELLAQLGDTAPSPLVLQNREKDAQACKIFKTIYSTCSRLTGKYFRPTRDGSFNHPPEVARPWIECWLGCASLNVQSGSQAWKSYLDQSWDYCQLISEEPWRRYMKTVILFTVLRLDPNVYTVLELHTSFIEVMFESLFPARVTIEAEYVPLMLSIDGLRHPLLQGARIGRESEDVDFVCSPENFADFSSSILQAVFTNLSALLREEAIGDFHAGETAKVAIDNLLKVFSAMRNTLEGWKNADEKAKYTRTILTAFESMHQHPNVESHRRLEFWAQWSHGLRQEAR